MLTGGGPERTWPLEFLDQAGQGAPHGPFDGESRALGAPRSGLGGCGVLAVVSVFHLSHREPWTAVVALIAVTPWIYMLAWVTASIGLFFQRRRLWSRSRRCSFCCSCGGWYRISTPYPTSLARRRGPYRVRLFDANVSQSNRNLDEIAEEVRRDKPQIVTMEELTPAVLWLIAGHSRDAALPLQPGAADGRRLRDGPVVRLPIS